MKAMHYKCDRCGAVMEFRPGNAENANTWWSLHLHAQGIGGELPVGGIQGDLCRNCYASLPEFWATFLKSEPAERAFREDPMRQKEWHYNMKEEVRQRIDAAVHDQSERLNKHHQKQLDDLRAVWQKETDAKVAKANQESYAWHTRTLAAALDKARGSHEADTKIRIARALEEARLLRARNQRSKTAKKRKQTTTKTCPKGKAHETRKTNPRGRLSVRQAGA